MTRHAAPRACCQVKSTSGRPTFRCVLLRPKSRVQSPLLFSTFRRRRLGYAGTFPQVPLDLPLANPHRQPTPTVTRYARQTKELTDDL